MAPPKCPHCGAELGGMGFVEIDEDDDDLGDDDDDLIDDEGPE